MSTLKYTPNRTGYVRIRLVSFLVFVGLFSAAYSLGAEMEVSKEEAELFMEEFGKLIDGIDGFGIFAHNTTLAIPMFIPAFGMFWGLFSAWSTGMAFSAITTVTPELADVPPLAILYLSPFGIMELVAYSIGTSRSYMLIHTIIRKNSLRSHLVPTAVEVGIVVGLLLAGGYIEFYMIEAAMESGFELPGL